MDSTSASAAPTARVIRNAGLLVVAQAVVAPLSILVNAVAARALGVIDFGRYYQALTFASFVFLFVEWGQPNVLTANVARNRPAAGEILGSGIVFRIGTAAIAGAVVPWMCAISGYERDFIFILALAMLSGAFATVSGACQDAFRGFERTDFAAASFIGWQLLSAAAVVPTLLLGGGVHGLLMAQISCAALGTAFVLKMTPRMQIPTLSVRWEVVKSLVRSGQPFLWFSLVLMLQPLVDAAMLSKFSAAEGLGWYAAARKLVGVLTYPASALLAALYPTLCRLHKEDMDVFRSTGADALYVVTIVVIPVALGCALFPELGVAIFGQVNYGPANDDLRLLAPYILLVYFSMPIGSCLASSGRQTAWTVLQFSCVIVSAFLDPPFIRWFQTHAGNGGLGVCAATVLSESLMVIGGVWLLPKGILAKLPRGKVLSALLSGGFMILVALSSGALDVAVRAVLAVFAYAVCLQVSGGADLLQLRFLLDRVRGRAVS
jgi:O-antigen/teichoic acid export membrane protein